MLHTDIIFWKRITRMLSHSFIYSFNKIYWEPVRPEEYRNKHNRQGWKLHKTNILMEKTETNYWARFKLRFDV